MTIKSIETFRDIGSYELSGLTMSEPSCFNGMVRVTRRRVTVEEIEEPVEVIQERLRKLWFKNKNHHNTHVLVSTGLKYGIDLRKEELK